MPPRIKVTASGCVMVRGASYLLELSFEWIEQNFGSLCAHHTDATSVRSRTRGK